MKTSALLVSAIILATALHGQTVLLEDNFNSYSTGTLTNSAAWPSTIPGTSPALSWTTNTGGPQAIVAGTVAGRSGNLYSYQENATGQTLTYSTVTMNSAYSGTENWVLAIDFYIESMPVGENAGTYSLITVSNGAVTTDANLVTAVSATRTSTNTHLNLFVTSGSGGFFWTPTNEAAIELQTWYTLTIEGNNDTEALAFNITGGSIDQDRSGSYRFSHDEFDTITMGDRFVNAFVTGRENHAYLDNFSLVAIPEPGTYALVFAAAMGLIVLLRRRR